MLVLVVPACQNAYKKVAKSTDLNYKLEMAKKYYTEGEYDKAIPLFEELIPLYKGTVSINEIYYMYAMSHYYQASYIIAGFHFKNIHDSYPLSQYAEESLYMAAFCDYSMSAEVPLDQTYTTKSINGFQLFINSYPNSDKVSEANQLIVQMRRKLEMKALQAAELYMKMGLYRSAASSFSNILIDFPDTRDAEKISFLIVKAYYLYAENSVRSKQLERYKQAMSAYKTFSKKYNSSALVTEAQKINSTVEKEVDRIKSEKEKTKRSWIKVS